MEMKPLTSWKCDKCGEAVSAEEGYVIWDGSGSPSDFHIIHQGRCDNKSLAYSQALQEFLGADGLAHLTSMISYGPAHLGRGKPESPEADSYIDFFRRVQLPFYEEARAAFNDAEVRANYDDSSESRPYMQDVLQRLADLKRA